jgi:hypothetical protein
MIVQISADTGWACDPISIPSGGIAKLIQESLVAEISVKT